MSGHRSCLITGAAGFIGAVLVRRLTELGWIVSGVDRNEVRQDRRVQSARIERMDVCDTPRMTALLHELRPDVVFHLAAQPYVPLSIDAPYRTVQDNVVATVSLLEAARLAGTGRVVHASSGAVYGAEPGDRVFTETSPTDAAPNLYGPSKIAAENIAHGYVRTYGQDIRICRFMNTYGPGDTSETRIVPTAIRLALEDLPYDFGDRDDGSTSLDFLYVDDVVDGYIAAATVSDDRRGSIYNFGSRRTTSLRELVDQVSQVVDGRKRTATFSGPPRIPPRRKHLDFTRTSSDIGWYPHTDLPDGLVATVNWYRKVGVRK